MSDVPLSEEERRDWLILSRSENVGPATFKTLIRRFHSAGAALRALPDLTRKGGLKRPPRIWSREAAERAMADAQKIGARFLCSIEPAYPALLRTADSAPPVLCVKGDERLFAKSGIAIVGARNASALARKFTRQLAREIGAEGHVIVSGLARGIDTAAHEAAIETGTIAVVAGGLDVIYPPENEALHAAICARGAIVSEQAPGTEPKADFFPRRNRIISGLSRALIVVEAALRSGSLITARFAAEQGREVFAAPGSPLDPRCEGTNRLIRDGATLLMSSRDVLEALGSNAPRQMSFLEPDPPPLPPREPDAADMRHVLELLSPNPIDIDDLARESGLDAATLSALLLELSLAGRVTRHADGSVSLA
ncbi:MAG: DNA-protecting protein DprA [Aestuariivirga sp.]|uniref:DNA-processing protein DprA n=1 Tax=Aestuariivirga sp. TaxID=2650926 RepID=UPI0025BF9E2F|nr:DNA-processing protein DprA [Aestuariivirga sp.]MCA3560964.1 DNA-protecting protein DprA [Aestuariivirga sp.]